MKKTLINLWYTGAVVAITVGTLIASKYLPGEQHIYFGLIPGWALLWRAEDFRDWLLDELL